MERRGPLLKEPNLYHSYIADKSKDQYKCFQDAGFTLQTSRLLLFLMI
jgi:hypothetical protein